MRASRKPQLSPYQVCQRRGLAEGPPGDEDEDAADEQNAAEALEEVAQDGERLVRLGRRRRIPAILLKPSPGLVAREAAGGGRDEPLGHVGRRDDVPFEVAEVWGADVQLAWPVSGWGGMEEPFAAVSAARASSARSLPLDSSIWNELSTSAGQAGLPRTLASLHCSILDREGQGRVHGPSRVDAADGERVCRIGATQRRTRAATRPSLLLIVAPAYALLWLRLGGLFARHGDGLRGYGGVETKRRERGWASSYDDEKGTAMVIPLGPRRHEPTRVRHLCCC